MACTGLDPMTYVPVAFPYVVGRRLYGCPCPRPFRYPRIDYARQFFCDTWGPSFQCICPPQKPRCRREPCALFGEGTKQFRGVGQEMQSLDYFSALPWRREGRFVGIRDLPTYQQDEGIAWVPTANNSQLGYSKTCKEKGTRLKPDLVKDDNTCGVCAPKDPNECKLTPRDICDDGFPGFDMSGKNLGFTVEVGEWDCPKPPRIRTGVERAIRPSCHMDWTTVYRDNHKDFMKIKTKKEISLYRSPLAIDKRRPGPRICPEKDFDLVVPVNSGPICFKANAIKYQVCKKCPPCPPCLPPKPDWEVILPGPICLP